MDELYVKFNYPSASKFKEILKQNGVSATHKQVADFVKSQSVAQLHKPTPNIKENYKFIVALKPFEMMQIDLLDYQKYSRQNGGNKYILIGVDVFTRYAFAKPIKDKTPESVLKAFQQFDAPDLMSVYHDSGNEFKGVFLEYLQENDIADLKAEIGDHHSLGVIDRFSKTFKGMIAKLMTANNNVKYANKINHLVNIYNETPHSSLGNIQPTKAILNKDFISKINFAKLQHNKEVDNKLGKAIKVGDYVRIKLKKTIFNKGYEITYSPDTFKVTALKGDKATLDDSQTVRVKDLQVIVQPDDAPVDKLLEAQQNAKVMRRVAREKKKLE